MVLLLLAPVLVLVMTEALSLVRVLELTSELVLVLVLTEALSLVRVLESAWN